MAEDPTKTGPAEDLEESEQEEGEGADPEGAEDEEEWTPPTREEWDAQQAALDAEKAKLARARGQAKRLREGAGRKAAPEGATAGEGAAGAQDGEVDVWRGRAVRASAKAALLDRGADSETVTLMLAGLKADQIEFDEDDEPELDAWLDEMEGSYPKLFTKGAAPAQPSRQRPGRVEQGAPSGAGRAARTKLSLGEQILANSQAAAGRRR